jgi:aspartyl-tRNA(Asn)/glutamyl-tRNA(Gln) amidotransferase subunit C
MALTHEEVSHIAWLARLSLSPAELARYAEQLSGILEHVERLGELDVAAIEPTAMASEDDRNVVRPDVPGTAYPQAAILANAADTEGGAFRVRAILEETA